MGVVEAPPDAPGDVAGGALLQGRVLVPALDAATGVVVHRGGKGAGNVATRRAVLCSRA